MTLELELSTAKRLAVEAGSVLLRHRTAPIDVLRKQGGEVVTAADREADRLICSGLRSAFPEDALLSEESADSPARLSNPRVWIVDPVDGTSDFIAGGNEFTVSIGLALNGRAVLGVVYNPVRDELFAGAPGFGATLNGVPVGVSDTADLSNARIAVSRKEWKRELQTLAPALPLVPMASVAYKLARVAAGMDDGMFYLRPRKQWDVCAGIALVAAAGGIPTLLDGREIAFNLPDPKLPLGLLATSPRLHPQLLKAVLQLHPNTG